MRNAPRAVAIIQDRLCHYRVPLFERLRQDLWDKAVVLSVVYGQADPRQKSREDSAELPWGTKIHNHRCRLGGVELVWQPCWHVARNSDLTIVTQENRLLLNYLLMTLKSGLGCRVAFWGHGRNLQSARPEGLRERWKRSWMKRPDWWFAYTDLTRDILLREGYRPDRITVLNNAVDTSGIQQWVDSITDEETQRVRSEIDVRSLNVGVYCGSLYSLKRVRFLLEAARRIRRTITDFELVVIGAGPDQGLVERASSRDRSIHYVGPRRDRDKVCYLRLGKVFLNPGVVGLSILDAFSLGLPIFTTECGLHGPEISYLKKGVNGFMVEDNMDAYCSAVVRVLGSDRELRMLSKRCREDARQYTIANMTRRFSAGIMAALNT